MRLTAISLAAVRGVGPEAWLIVLSIVFRSSSANSPLTALLIEPRLVPAGLAELTAVDLNQGESSG